ncbi:AraC family transcriptional regulator [Acuticoccus sp. MNP-M23]|uniref:AraC family transcriptional regulator n=1 Tax=Acuticoccus sp. MNP-M23 TaxID=3072793 RepID=UPI0028156F25|nr:AraC family transcriptional regulator [Acuticoccus sp. MNP-M23]WMS41323.1 AraC family transcriptional regulator [Acuticoccus sp. MNP-M23]
MSLQRRRRIMGSALCGGGGVDMFPETLDLTFLDPDAGWLETRYDTLGNDGLELWEVVSTGHEVSLNEPNKASVIVPTRGTVDVATHAGEYSASRGSALLFGPNNRRTRVRPHASGTYEALVLLVPQASHQRATGPLRQDLAHVEACLKGGAGTLQELTDHLLALRAVLSDPRSAPAGQRARDNSAALLADLFAELVDSVAGAKTTARSTPGIEYVRRIEELMREHHGDPLTVSELAGAVGLGKRSLQLAFKRHRDTTPRAALRRIRLDEARQRFAAADPDESVTSIALDTGFTHLGRFAVEYRSAFGESPSDTLRRARSR